MKIITKLESSRIRFYLASPIKQTRSAFLIDSAKNGFFSFQLALRNEVAVAFEEKNDLPIPVSVAATVPKNWSIRVRRVGYVSVAHKNTRTALHDIEGADHLPGFVPDPLFDEQQINLPANETHAFWFSVKPSPDTKCGLYKIDVIVELPNNKREVLQVAVNIHDVAIKHRKDFFVTNWFYNDAIFDFYDCKPFDKKYWEILPRFFNNMVNHGQDTILVPVFTPPLDGVKRPSQLLVVSKIGKNRYRFDWKWVKRYIQEAKKAGFTKFEWSHLFTQWGASKAIRIYHGIGLDEKLLWNSDTVATSPTYKTFLSQFLPEFYKFLIREKLFSASYFHLSDEPTGEEHRKNYLKARNMLRDLAPWMQVMDALSEIEFAKEGLTDQPVPIINTAIDFINDNISCSCYFCCWPRGPYLNRLLDTPLSKIGVSGWLFSKWSFKGFLHWGYNYWYKSQTREKINPFTVQDGHAWPGWAYGDCFIVYPGKEGPIDSIRWEVFAESLQDYALIQQLDSKSKAKLLMEFISFREFPHSVMWYSKARRTLLGKLSKVK